MFVPNILHALLSQTAVQFNAVSDSSHTTAENDVNDALVFDRLTKSHVGDSYAHSVGQYPGNAKSVSLSIDSLKSTSQTVQTATGGQAGRFSAPAVTFAHVSFSTGSVSRAGSEDLDDAALTSQSSRGTINWAPASDIGHSEMVTESPVSTTSMSSFPPADTRIRVGPSNRNENQGACLTAASGYFLSVCAAIVHHLCI